MGRKQVRYNELRIMRREERRRIVMELLSTGVQTNRSVRAYLKANYPSLPRSQKTIHLDLATIRSQFASEDRCTGCGRRLHQ